MRKRVLGEKLRVENEAESSEGKNEIEIDNENENKSSHNKIVSQD